MNWKKLFALGAIASLMTFAAHADEIKVGVVNFQKCVMESKIGKKENENFDALKKQMTSIVTDIESQIQGMATKFNDPEVMDGLSPEAEEEMKGRFQSLNEDYNRAQNQYMQVMQQANMQLIHKMGGLITQASKELAKDKGLSFVMRDDVCFYYNADQDDVTAEVISILDKQFEVEAKKAAKAAAK